MNALRAFRIFAVEAFRDGLRRRLGFAVAIVLVIGLAGAQSCTRFGSGGLNVNGQMIDGRVIGGFLAPILFAFQAWAVLAIAGLLAADHLARPLAEGSAVLWLSRPVSRGVWASARLAGALGIALSCGALLLGGTGAMLVLRQGVAIGPALDATAATALGALVVASLAMTASLALGRMAVILLVLLGLVFLAFANGVGLANEIAHPEVVVGGLLGTVDRYGPPLFTAIVGAVVGWNPHIDPGDSFPNAMLRLAVWALGGVALLIAAFRRREIES
jgi:ABC-type transport system involved in multi-copper enzyme maturation permease subunit